MQDPSCIELDHARGCFRPARFFLRADCRATLGNNYNKFDAMLARGRGSGWIGVTENMFLVFRDADGRVVESRSCGALQADDCVEVLAANYRTGGGTVVRLDANLWYAQSADGKVLTVSVEPTDVAEKA